MNLRHFTLALLISALPQVHATETAAIKLDKGDFLSAEQITRDGETLVRVRLSKSGKAKIRKLSRSAMGSEIRIEVGGVSKHFKLKVPIEGDDLEMGPYNQAGASKVVKTVNGQ